MEFYWNDYPETPENNKFIRMRKKKKKELDLLFEILAATPLEASSGTSIIFIFIQNIAI